MIGNDYLQALFNYPDEDTGLNQLLELLTNKDMEFINSLKRPINLALCNENEITYLTKASALIDYHLQVLGLEVPDWLRDEKLAFDRPYYHSTRISDFEKLRFQFRSPAPFKARNVYFDLYGIKRV